MQIKEMEYDKFAEIRMASEMPVTKKCSECNKELKAGSKIYFVPSGDNFKIICEKCYHEKYEEKKEPVEGHYDENNVLDVVVEDKIEKETKEEPKKA